MKRMGGRNIKVINSAAILTLIGVLQVAWAQSGSRAQGEGPILHLCCKLGNLRPNSLVGNFDCDFEKGNGGSEYFKFRWEIPPWLSPAGPSQFRLQYRNTTCQEYGRVLSVPLVDGRASNNTPIVTFLANSYLKHGSEFFHNNEYCLNKLTPTLVDIRLCTPKCSPILGLLRDKKRKKRSSDSVPRQTACVRKCCDAGKSIKLIGGSKLSCQESSIPFRPIVFSEKMKQLDGEEQEAIDFHFAKSKLECEVGRPQFFPFSRQMALGSGFSNLCFRPKWDGKVFFLNSEKRWTGPETYCIDSVIDYRDNAASSYETSESELGIVMCSLPPTASEGPSRKLYGGLMISSSVFLLLTFIVYLLLWDQHGLHGWTTLGHSSSMFFMYIFLGTAHILQVQQTKGIAVLKTMECVAVGVLAHFFFLSTFCWLTLISFDLWYTFRSFNPNTSKSKNAKRFCFYVFFGWGVPTIFVTVSRILDNQLSDDACSTIVLPQYGQYSCYVNPKALGEYIYYPIAVLLLLNLIFFGVTTWKLYQYRKSTRVATENLDNKRQFFKLFLKLFCVMGVTWILEVVSFLHVGTEIPWYWNVVDSLNVCQAIAVFIIYVCKKETVFALRKSYPKMKVILDPLIKLFRCKAPASDTKSSTMRRRYGDSTRASMLSSRATQRSTTGSTMETDA